MVINGYVAVRAMMPPSAPLMPSIAESETVMVLDHQESAEGFVLQSHNIWVHHHSVHAVLQGALGHQVEQHAAQRMDRQPNHIKVATINAPYKAACHLLYAITTRFAKRLACAMW